MNKPKQPQPKMILPTTSVATSLGFPNTTLLTPITALYAAGIGAGIGITGFIIDLYPIINALASILFGRVIES